MTQDGELKLAIKWWFRQHGSSPPACDYFFIKRRVKTSMHLQFKLSTWQNDSLVWLWFPLTGGSSEIQRTRNHIRLQIYLYLIIICLMSH